MGMDFVCSEYIEIVVQYDISLAPIQYVLVASPAITKLQPAVGAIDVMVVLNQALSTYQSHHGHWKVAEAFTLEINFCYFMPTEEINVSQCELQTFICLKYKIRNKSYC